MCVDGVIYVAGQGGFDPKTGRLGETIEEQTEQTLNPPYLLQWGLQPRFGGRYPPHPPHPLTTALQTLRASMGILGARGVILRASVWSAVPAGGGGGTAFDWASVRET